MSGSFTLTGQLMHHDKVTPHVDAPLAITAAVFPDGSDDVIYSQGADVVTDADGSFSVSLLTETDLYYTVTSLSTPALFAPITFLAPAAGSTHDLSEYTTMGAPVVDPSVLTETLAARDAAVAAAASVAYATWNPTTVYASGQVVQAPGGVLIRSTSARTSGASFSTTEASNWRPVLGAWTPQMFGAKADGATDDTTAVQAAITAAQVFGGVVFFPAGTYYIFTVYVTASNVTLRGAGIGATVLKHRPVSGGAADTRLVAVNGPIVGGSTPAAGSYLSNVFVEDMTLDNNAGTAAAPVVSSTVNSTFVQGTVSMFQTKHSAVRRVYVVNPRDIGILAFGCLYTEIENSTVDGMVGSFQVNSIMISGTGNGGTGATANDRPSQFIRVKSCRVIRNWWLQGDQPSGYFTGSGMGVNVQGSDDVEVVDCEVDFTGEPAARGRNGSGIIFEAGGTSVNFGVLHRCHAVGNRVKYANIGIAAETTSSGANDVTGNIVGVDFTGNIVDDAIIGIHACGSRVAISGNVVYAGRAIRLGNSDSSHEENYNVTGNTIRISPQSQLYGVSGNKSTTGGYLKGVVVANNVIDGQELTTLTGNPVGISFTGEVTAFVIAGNVIRNIPTNGIRLDPVSSSDNTQPRPRNGRIVNNELVNVVNLAAATYPQYYGICSTGTDYVVCMQNKIVSSGAGNSSYRDTASENTGVMTIFGNLKDSNAVATDRGNASLRLGGTVSGVKAGGTAFPSLIAALVNMQAVTDTTT